MLHRFPVLASLLVLIAACSGVNEQSSPRIVIQPDNVTFQNVPIGAESIRTVEISNEGTGVLRVTGVSVDVTPDGVVSVPNFTELTLEPGQEEIITIAYAPQSPAAMSGEIVFSTNDPSSPNAEVQVTGLAAQPRPAVTPSRLDFGLVAEDSNNELPASIQNIGSGPLYICDAFLAAGFDITTDISEAYQANLDESGFVLISGAGSDSGGLNQLSFKLFYAPLSPGIDEDELVIIYDRVGEASTACDEENQETASFPVTGEAGAPQLRVDPNPINFGNTPIDFEKERLVTLTNTGALELVIYDITLDPTTAPEFSITNLPDLPISLEAGGVTDFTATYLPEDFIGHAGFVLVNHSDGGGARTTTQVQMAGLGVEDDCPDAVAEAFLREDDQNRRGTQVDWAIPLQTLVLDGTASFDPDGSPITDYVWEMIEFPPEVVTGPQPFTGDPDNDAIRQFFIPIAGRYVFELRVFDENGFESCEPATVTVVATPTEAIAVELLWTNPADPDESDNEGADNDLHFVKMPNRWFHPTFDTYFSNTEPNWSPELPSLDIDDTDGAGPETTQLDNPQPDECYAIGVHYFRKAFGTSYPTVRIYIDGVLSAEFYGELRETDDFWDVARIHWPSRTVYQNDAYIENFNSEDGIRPEPTEAMIRNGHCTF